MSEYALSVTLKAGTGYDSPWIVVYGNDPGEVTTKLNAITSGALVQATVEAANALKAANTAAPLLAHSEPAAQQAAPVPTQNGWGQQPPQQVHRGGGQPYNPQGGGNAVTHPEGKSCDACGQVLVYKKTSSGKATWRCEQWRWNNGSPNEHTQIWV